MLNTVMRIVEESALLVICTQRLQQARLCGEAGNILVMAVSERSINILATLCHNVKT